MKGIWKEQKENVEKKEVKIENEPGKELYHDSFFSFVVRSK